MLETLPHLITREEYHRMGESGEIAPDARVELLNGEIIDMFPIGPFHNSSIGWLNEQLVAAGKGRWLTLPQCSFNLSPISEPQPDFILARPRRDRYVHALVAARDVFWLIEVADSSLDSDKTRKVPAYAAAGIPEVWIVNRPRKVVEVYRNPNPGGYGDLRIAKVGETVSPQSFPDFILSITELFAET